MRYLSVCSGIEAASVAWIDLNWSPVGFSEIEPFPCAVLKHHYKDVPNYGDITQNASWPITTGSADILVGGTPCQAFSIAGLRQGLADPRGNLALVFLGLADRLKPRWIVWENVPGVLSSGGGRDFGTFVGALVQLGYGFCYRVLDAQFFGVPQRRRRVFLVGYLGDWRRAATVLFEPHRVQGNYSTRGQERKDLAPTLAARTGAGGGLGTDADLGGALIAPPLTNEDKAGTLSTWSAAKGESGSGVASHLVPGFIHPRQLRGSESSNQVGIKPEAQISDALTTEGPGAVCTAFSSKDYGGDASSIAPTLRAMNHGDSHANGGGQVAATTARGVRRLTPMECERLQGFPDGYTKIPWRGRAAEDCPDGPRYKALGNSMAVPVMRWIGERIAVVDAQLKG